MRAQRSNPDRFRGGTLDCFAALAMTIWGQCALIEHRHPEVLASSASLEGRRPGPCRLPARCFASRHSRLRMTGLIAEAERPSGR
ncbi:hypothetical protein Bdiaspc4_13000 [Bradyrhizobium diazoefficiens]|nr:hypothetical protein Bdiaspc4_13000 [Bradyrhizobium diazoefficiens]